MLGGAADHARQSAGVTVCTCWSSASRGDTQQLGRAAGLVPCRSGPWNVLQGCRASVTMLPRWARLEAMLSSWWDGHFASLPRQECRMCSISGSAPWTGDPRQAGWQLRSVARRAHQFSSAHGQSCWLVSGWRTAACRNVVLQDLSAGYCKPCPLVHLSLVPGGRAPGVPQSVPQHWRTGCPP